MTHSTVHELGCLFYTPKCTEGKRIKRTSKSVHDSGLCAFQSYLALHGLLKRPDYGSRLPSRSLRDLPTMNLRADNWFPILTSGYTANLEEMRSAPRIRKWDPLYVSIPFASWGQLPTPYTSQQVCIHSPFSLQLPHRGIFHPEKVGRWFQAPWFVIVPWDSVLWIAQP